MKTIFISTSLPGRARPDYFFALAKSFAEDGCRIIMIFDGKPENLPKDDNIISLAWPSKRPTKLIDFIFLTKLIKEYKPITLISSFGSVNIMNICGYLSKVKNRINYILSVSEPFYQKPSFGQIVRRKFLKSRKKRVYSLATLLVTNSIGTEQDAIGYYGLEKKEFLVLHNLITDTNLRFKPREERRNQIVIVGNLIKRKGHHFLINQFEKTLEIYPKLKLVIIGGGPEKKQLELQVQKSEMLKNIEFIGEVPNKKIASYFSDSLISISSSIHEAFGFVNIEAMREGTPIISTPTAGAMEILKENQNGKFFSLDELNSLTNAVSVILNNWDSFSSKALESFNSYSLESQINTHRELLNESIK